MVSEEKNVKRGRLLGCVVISFIFALGVFTIIYSALKLPYRGSYSLGSGFLPLWLGIFICALSALLFVQTLMGKYDKLTNILPSKENGLRIIFYIVISCVTVSLLRTLGMHICDFIFLLATMKLVESRSWKMSLLTALIGSVSIYILFDLLFNVNFPVGIFGF